MRTSHVVEHLVALSQHLAAGIALHRADVAIDPHQIGLALRVQRRASLPPAAARARAAAAARSRRRGSGRGAASRSAFRAGPARRRTPAGAGVWRMSARSRCSSAVSSARHGASSTRCRRRPAASRCQRTAAGAADQPVRTRRPSASYCTSRFAIPAPIPEAQQRRGHLRPERESRARTVRRAAVDGCGPVDASRRGSAWKRGRRPGAERDRGRPRTRPARCGSDRTWRGARRTRPARHDRNRRRRRKDTRRSPVRDRRVSAVGQSSRHSPPAIQPAYVQRGSLRIRLGLCQLPAQHRKPLIQPRLDRAQRTPDEIRDLLKRQPVILLQHDRRPLLLRAAAPWRARPRASDPSARPDPRSIPTVRPRR